jgi:cysteine desulfurase
LLYFDHNATTPVAPEVAETMHGALCGAFGNPSSTHREGQLARQQLEDARRAIAGFLHASAPEIVFTSGGTEANNLAILGLPTDGKHVITTAMEHPSVLEPFRQLEQKGVAVTYLRPNRHGMVEAEAVRQNLRPETVLVSVIHANNETGMIQPITRIAALLRETGQRFYFHSDGVQALGKIPVNVEELGVDLYSISAHKVYAPKGTGALFVRKGTPLHAIQHGGRHERERRAGTENVPGAMCFARALELCDSAGGADSQSTASRLVSTLGLSSLRDEFESHVLSSLDDIEINGAREPRLPNTSNLLFRGISAEALLIALDMRGIAVSTGSACSSGSIEPSPVLLAMGRSRAEAKSSVRFSLGRYNTAADVRGLTDAVIACARQLRKTSSREKQLVG